MSNNFNKPNTSTRAKSVLEEPKLRLTAPPIEKGARPATMHVGMYRNNPQMTMYPNHDNGSGVTWMSAGMNMHTFEMMLQAVDFLAQEDAMPNTIDIENFTDIPKEQRTDPRVRQTLKNKIRIIRNEDGTMAIGIIDSNNAQAPRVVFKFGLNYYHKMRDKAGIFDEARQSRMAALSWTSMYRHLVYNVAASNGQNPQNAEATGGGNGGGYQNKGYQNKGGGNNYQQKQGGNSYQQKPSNSSHEMATDDFDDGDF